MEFLTKKRPRMVDAVSFFLTYIEIWNHHMIKYLSYRDQRNFIVAKGLCYKFGVPRNCFFPWCKCRMGFACNFNEILHWGWGPEFVLFAKKNPTAFAESVNKVVIYCSEEALSGHKICDEYEKIYDKTARVVFLPRRNMIAQDSKRIKLEKQ